MRKVRSSISINAAPNQYSRLVDPPSQQLAVVLEYQQEYFNSQGGCIVLLIVLLASQYQLVVLLDYLFALPEDKEGQPSHQPAKRVRVRTGAIASWKPGPLAGGMPPTTPFLVSSKDIHLNSEVCATNLVFTSLKQMTSTDLALSLVTIEIFSTPPTFVKRRMVS